MPVEHNPYDDEKLVQLRADQEDPLVVYLVVRKDLEMGVGKIAAQCSHASDMLCLRIKDLTCGKRHMYLDDKTILAMSWLAASFRKIVKTAKKSDFDKLKEELDVFVVRDAGLTEVEMGTETVLCTWPMRKSQTPKRLVRMRLLK